MYIYMYLLVFVMAAVLNYPLVLLTFSSKNKRQKTDFCCFSLFTLFIYGNVVMRRKSHEQQQSQNSAQTVLPSSGMRWESKGCPL